LTEKKYHGVIVPLVTPFDVSRNIDNASVKKLIKHVLDADAFPFILGTTGECQSMTFTKQLDLVKLVSECVGRKKTIYAGISNNSLDNSIESAKQFYQSGVDVFVAHLPSYYPISEDHIQHYYETLADAVPAPVMIYNIPSTTHISIPLEIITALADHPNICGVKDSERSLDRITAFGKAFSKRNDFTILSGWTNQSLFALLQGFDGIVPSTANMNPADFQNLYKSVKNGDVKQAEQVQEHIDIVADLHQKNVKFYEMIPLLKIMLNSRGLCEKFVLSPLLPVDKIQENNFRTELSKLQI